MIAQINDLSKKISRVKQEIEDLYREYAGLNPVSMSPVNVSTARRRAAAARQNWQKGRRLKGD
jgi:hypothetical protein